MSDMRRHGVCAGTREEILAELDALGDGLCRPGQDCLDQRRQDKARRIARAWHAIDAGADEVDLGRTVYVVVEG